MAIAAAFESGASPPGGLNKSLRPTSCARPIESEPPAALTFPHATYLGRIASVQRRLAEMRCDALVAFLPESVTYLTGFFTRGYGSLQLALVPATGEPIVVCRDVEEYHLGRTCAFQTHVLWTDSEDQIRVAADTIRHGLGRAAVLAIEKHAWPLSAARFERLQASLPEIRWIAGDTLVAEMRLIKSSEEIEIQRRASRAAEAGMRAGIESAAEGVSERRVASAVCSAMVMAGSDSPGPGVLSSGDAAFHLHGSYGDRVLRRGDTMQLETTPNVRQYHARFMRPIKVSAATEEEHRTVETLVRIQDEALAAVKPGVPARVADGIYREGVLSAGLSRTYTNKTFYSVGLILAPNSSEFLEATALSDWLFQPGMVFHTYVLARGLGISETILVTETGCERLTTFPRRLFVGGSD